LAKFKLKARGSSPGGGGGNSSRCDDDDEASVDESPPSTIVGGDNEGTGAKPAAGDRNERAVALRLFSEAIAAAIMELGGWRPRAGNKSMSKALLLLPLPTTPVFVWLVEGSKAQRDSSTSVADTSNSTDSSARSRTWLLMAVRVHGAAGAARRQSRLKTSRNKSAKPWFGRSRPLELLLLLLLFAVLL
jgi:hypothetical protein